MKSDWIEALSFASELLTDNQIGHVFIKTLFDPFDMTDVDVLIPNSKEVRKVINLLQKKDFEIRKPSPVLRPLKASAHKNGWPPIDIYPKARFGLMKVGNGRKIITRSRTSNLGGVKARIPSPEDSLYLISVHSFYHSRIKQSEVENVNSLVISELDQFDWNYLNKLAKSFGTSACVYSFLKAMNLNSPNTVRDETLAISADEKVCKLVDIWFEDIGKSGFPLRIPPLLDIIFPFTRVPSLLSRANFGEILLYFFSHYKGLLKKQLLQS